MARPTEGWKLRRHGKLYYVRFSHGGQRVELATGARDPEEAARRAARLYADHCVSKPRERLKSSDPRAPLAEVAAGWLADIEGELDATTLATFMVYVRHFDSAFRTLGGIDDAACAQYSRERLRSVKRQTVLKELSALRRFVAWCVQRGILTRAPSIPSPPRRASGTPFEKRRRSKATIITPEQAIAIIEALPEWSRARKGLRYPVRARFRVAWETALRPFTLDCLSVPENYTRGASVLVITDDIDKARFGRELPLTTAARAALDGVCPERGRIFGRHDYRFQLRSAAKKLLPEEKVRTFAAYDLRHARATEWAESGNLVGVAYLLGHKNITTTNRYTRANRAAAERVLGVKDSAYGGALLRRSSGEAGAWYPSRLVA